MTAVLRTAFSRGSSTPQYFNDDTFEIRCYFNDSSAEDCYFLEALLPLNTFTTTIFEDCYFTKPEENTRQDRKDTTVIKVKLEDL